MADRMTDPKPDATAVRVALWRAQHVLLDDPPHVLADDIGLRLVDPPDGWQRRRDMDPRATSRNRASIVARARFTEDEVEAAAGRGVDQYVLLGAGLDTLAVRRPDLAERVRIFEIDQPGTQAWKQRRLAELGVALPDGLAFVPVDFEGGGSWVDALERAGFDRERPTVVSSLGVAMYLTGPTIAATLGAVASFAPGSELIMSFMVPIDLVDADEVGGRRGAERGAAAGGTPFLSFFTPEEALDAGRAAGFASVAHVSHVDLAARYFADRSDGLHPASSEQILVARTEPQPGR